LARWKYLFCRCFLFTLPMAAADEKFYGIETAGLEARVPHRLASFRPSLSDLIPC
jgi:hypothetical protein